jgi:hypothetical protein
MKALTPDTYTLSGIRDARSAPPGCHPIFRSSGALRGPHHPPFAKWSAGQTTSTPATFAPKSWPKCLRSPMASQPFGTNDPRYWVRGFPRLSRRPKNSSRPVPIRSAAQPAMAGNGSSTILPTLAQGPMSTETSSPTVVGLTRHPSPEVPSPTRDSSASSSELKTVSALSPESSFTVSTSMRPSWWLIAKHDGRVGPSIEGAPFRIPGGENTITRSTRAGPSGSFDSRTGISP